MTFQLKYGFLLFLLFSLQGILHAQLNENNINTETMDFERVIPPERFNIIQNTSFELSFDAENYTHPIHAYSLSCRFGLRNLKLTNKYEMGVHRGVDIVANTGTHVYAILDGVVRISQYQDKGYGNVVVIRHKDGLESLYAHLKCRYVSVEQKIVSGECIGLSGNTGTSLGPHLHFELSTESGRFDPGLLIDFKKGKLKNIQTEK